MATIQDVARHANVGVGTVSRVLSGKGYVKAETRQKVQASIEALDYTPNEMARNLFFQKSGIVAVIVPEVAHPFFAQFVCDAEAALCQKNYQTMICNTYYEKNYERRYLELLKRQRVDGIIFCAHTALDVSQYECVKRPIVAMDRDLGESIPCVAADHESGGIMAAEELIRSGCRHVLQFGGAEEKKEISTPSNIRHQVFQKTLKEHGISCHTCYTNWHSSNASYYRKVADEALEKYPETDGVFATDMIAMAVQQSALVHGRKIPEDLKLVTYDGTCGIGLTYPRISAIVQPIAELAEKAVEMVVDQIEGKPVLNTKVKLPVTFCPGDTTLGR